MRILVVEDDPGIRDFIQDGLTSLPDMEVDTAADHGAVLMARQTSYDVIVADMHLSDDLDALCIIREVTVFDHRVKFIVMTGKKRLDVATKLVHALKGNQVASFLFKPFEIGELHIAVLQAVKEMSPAEIVDTSAPRP
jgi:DNA-binding NtrC family response regulator